MAKRKKNIYRIEYYTHKCPHRVRCTRRVITLTTLAVRPPRRPLHNKKIPSSAPIPKMFNYRRTTTAWPYYCLRTILPYCRPTAVTWVSAVLSPEQPRSIPFARILYDIVRVLCDFSLKTRDERRGIGTTCRRHCLLLCSTTHFLHDKSVKNVNPPRIRGRFG